MNVRERLIDTPSWKDNHNKALGWAESTEMAGRGSTDVRTLLVGIDGACTEVLDPLVESGAVPTLSRFLEGGSSAPLESGIPPWTPSAWPSLYTGMNPGKHGVFGFLHFDGYDWEVVNATHVRERPIWELLDRHDLASVVVNVPVTEPQGAFDGALIPGYTAREDPDCHPEGLLEEVRNEVGEYQVYPPKETPPAAAHAEQARQRGAAFRYLAEEFEPDLGFVQFQGTDTIIHERPGDREALRTVYGAVDDAVAAILEHCEPDTVVLASDHGVGPYSGHEFRVNEFLRERGDVVTVAGEGGMPSWGVVREDQFRSDNRGEYPGVGAMSRALSVAARIGITSQRLKRVLESLGLVETIADHVPEGLVHAGAESVDFPRSRAFMRSRIELGVRINLEGREPEGVVPPEEYESVRESLIDALSAVETPAGRPVFEAVLPREAVFHGRATGRAPDVITVPAEFDQFLSARVQGEIFGAPSEPWNHKRHGIVALSGEGVDQCDLGDPHLLDVAPTVLATLGVPADQRMDGTVLPAVEAVGNRAYPGPDRSTPSGTGSRGVERRLADLGYLEEP